LHMTQKSNPPVNTFPRPKRKPRLKPGRRVLITDEEKERYEALMNSQDKSYEQIISSGRIKV